MEIRHCPHCGTGPVAHNAMRPGEYACPECNWEFLVEDLGPENVQGKAAARAVGDFVLEASPQAALAEATAELQEIADDDVLYPPGCAPTTGDGGPAFPRPAFGGDRSCEPWNDQQIGMTLRDWFAGQALAGIAYKPWLSTPNNSVFEGAFLAYRLADEMLKVRSEVKEARHG